MEKNLSHANNMSLYCINIVRKEQIIWKLLIKTYTTVHIYTIIQIHNYTYYKRKVLWRNTIYTLKLAFLKYVGTKVANK